MVSAEQKIFCSQAGACPICSDQLFPRQFPPRDEKAQNAEDGMKAMSVTRHRRLPFSSILLGLCPFSPGVDSIDKKANTAESYLRGPPIRIS